jgi:hypothetical protein
MKYSALQLLGSLTPVVLAAIDEAAVLATNIKTISDAPEGFEGLEGFKGFENPEGLAEEAMVSGPTVKILGKKDLTTGKPLTTVWDSEKSKLQEFLLRRRH